MQSLQQIAQDILVRIQDLGYVVFFVLLVADIILYRIHPVLGFLGSLFIFAILLGFI